jgi:hypothetical protein
MAMAGFLLVVFFLLRTEGVNCSQLLHLNQ